MSPEDFCAVGPDLGEEERLVQQTVARFVDERVLPVIPEAFEAGRSPPSSSLKSVHWAFWAVRSVGMAVQD